MSLLIVNTQVLFICYYCLIKYLTENNLVVDKNKQNLCSIFKDKFFSFNAVSLFLNRKR